MPSHADLDIIARDKRLPGLPLAMDIAALAARLGGENLRQTYFNYKPGTSCTVGYLDATGQGFAAMAYPADRLDEIKTRRKWFEGEDRARVLEDVGMVIVPMSLDRRVKAAQCLANPGAHLHFFQQLLAADVASECLSSDIIRYKPKRRIVARLMCNDSTRALLKCYDSKGFEAAERGARLAELTGGPPLLGMDEKRRSLATAWIDGSSLCPELSGHLRLDAFTAAGEWLGDFHRRPPQLDRPLPTEARDDLTLPLSRIASDFAILVPALAPRLNELVARVGTACTAAPAGATLIHGDMSADQVILAPQAADLSAGKPVVIDWDRAVIGSALRDIGSFLARLDMQCLVGSIDENSARSAQQAFLHGYRHSLSASGWQLVDAFHARALLLLTSECFRHRLCNWYQLTENLLRRVDELMPAAAAARTTTAAGESTETLPALLATALDLDRMRAPVARVLGVDTGQQEVRTPQLLRYKTARRALIRYEAGDPDQASAPASTVALGKLTLRKRDRHTPDLHDRLRTAGFDSDSRHGVSVPAYLGRHDAVNIWFQELAPGQELSNWLQPGTDPGPFRQAGIALAHLHAADVQARRDWSMVDEAGVLYQALQRASRARPDLAARIEACRDHAQSLFESLPVTAPRLIHRDFYPDQLLIDGERVWLVDLDLCAQGDATIDIGNFLAHITEYAVRCFGGASALDTQAQAFIAGYCSLDTDYDPWRVAVLETLSLARHLYISTTFPARLHTTDPLLALCESRLASLTDSRFSLATG